MYIKSQNSQNIRHLRQCAQSRHSVAASRLALGPVRQLWFRNQAISKLPDFETGKMKWQWRENEPISHISHTTSANSAGYGLETIKLTVRDVEGKVKPKKK
jgi:hypothetical protein